jgi:cobalt-zinc-cadmium resistance protein CzcA
MQDTLAAAIGGRDAGMIFEGDRRFAVTIRLTDAARADLSKRSGQVPVPTPMAHSFRSKASPTSR